MLFTRDLRVRDHAALTAAAALADCVVPLFVFDEDLQRVGFVRPNRARFLLEALADLDRSLAMRGGRLVLRRGNVAAEVSAVVRAAGAQAVFVSADVSAHAARRQRRLAAACAESGAELRLFPGVTVVPAGAIAPARGDHFRVFTPYWQRWRGLPLPRAVRPPSRLAVPRGIAGIDPPALRDLVDGAASPDLPRGGESAGRARLDAWMRTGLRRYPAHRDDLTTDGTSRLGPYLHFGCLSPAEVARRCAARPGDEAARPGGDAFLRQLCWRDFHHQVTVAFPEIARREYRSRRDRWRHDEELLAAWKDGRTGYPLVDAGMRQLRREGWMPNRARLVTASFLVKDLYLDWRLGAAHFIDLLVDGDLANNSGNWQWVAGTGNDTRPNRVFNPVRQAERFDPDGEYVRRWVPELVALPGARVHQPWRADPELRRRFDYPAPVANHDEAARAFRVRRG